MAIRHAIHSIPVAPAATIAPPLPRTASQADAAAWPAFLERLRLVLRNARTRRQLARLDERALRDIGLSRAEALAEAERVPWDLGPSRRH
jgi:uncharacterized protein YjiS (DUF1127 family)